MTMHPKLTQRGSVMLLTLFLLLILALMGTGFLALLPVELRSARADRSAVQSAFGAEAAVQSAMNSLNVVMNDGIASTDYADIPTGNVVGVGNGWNYTLESVTPIGRDQFRVTATGGLRNSVQRRVVAIIDDGSGEDAVAMKATTTIDGNSPSPGWPTSVPIKGDIFWLGTFECDNSGFDMSDTSAPPFLGTIYQTKQDGDGLRDENYTSSNPTSAQYPSLYSKGMAAIQPAGTVAASELLNSTQTQQSLLGEVFAEANGASAAAEGAAIVTNRAGHVEKVGSAMTGGIFINDTNGNPNGGGAAAQAQRQFKIRFTAPSPGIGVTTVSRGDGLTTTITTVEAGATLPAGLSGPVTSVDDRIAIRSVGGPAGTVHLNELLTTDIQTGHVMYIDGEVSSMQGTYRGNRTVGVRGDTIIDGELLKSDTPRGVAPGVGSEDALGIVGTIKASNNSVGTNITISNGASGTYPAPADSTYYIYAYLTGLDGNDTNGKLFKSASIPTSHKIELMGSLHIAPSNSGQLGHTFDFIADNFKGVTVDTTRPYGFPGPKRYSARVRAYADSIVAGAN